MEPGTGFLFIQEMGNRPLEKRVRSDIKMHVADRLVTQRRMRGKRRGGSRELLARDWTGNVNTNENSGEGDDENDEVQGAAVVRIRGSEVWGVGEATSAQDMLGLSGLGIQMDEQTRFFLHHFLHHTSKSLCTVTTETGWLTYALKNQTLFYSTLYHWVLLNQESLPDDFKRQDRLLNLKGTAIRMINRDFERSSRGQGEEETSGDWVGVRDELIASVTCLASVNWLIGDFKEAGIHFKGLKAMISRRKGVRNLGFGGLIGRLVRWTDSCRAQVANTQLCLDQNACPTENPIDATFIAPQPQILEAKIIERLRSISLELMATPRNLLPPERRVTMGQQFLASDRELLSHIHGDTYLHQPMLSLFALAALIYSECILRGMGRSSRVIKTIVGLLRSRILELKDRDGGYGNGVNGRLYWAVIIGVLATEKWSVEGMWFLDFLVGIWGPVEGMWERVVALQDERNEVSPAGFNWVLGDEVFNMVDYRTTVTLE